MCGEHPQCSSKRQGVVSFADGQQDCDSTRCSYTSSSVPFQGVVYSCKEQRGPEVCERITKYYNPLYVGKALNSYGSPVDTACDDGKGKHLGSYQCLGNKITISNMQYEALLLNVHISFCNYLLQNK